jgi:hypothetical protein
MRSFFCLLDEPPEEEEEGVADEKERRGLEQAFVGHGFFEEGACRKGERNSKKKRGQG